MKVASPRLLQRENKRGKKTFACACLRGHCCKYHAAGNRLGSKSKGWRAEAIAECGSGGGGGGGPQVWTYSAECASKMRDEQDSLDLALFIGIDWSNMHNKCSQRSICNISRFTSCGPNNLGGKWVMTVALGPDTLTMFDEWPKGWGDDHLNDHTTERNTMESLVRKISNPNSGCQSVSLETT